MFQKIIRNRRNFFSENVSVYFKNLRFEGFLKMKVCFSEYWITMKRLLMFALHLLDQDTFIFYSLWKNICNNATQMRIYVAIKYKHFCSFKFFSLQFKFKLNMNNLQLLLNITGFSDVDLNKNINSRIN